MQPEMSAYEARAWAALIADELKHRNSVFVRAGNKVEQFTTKAGEQIRKNPIGKKVLDLGDETIFKGLEGAFKAVFMPAVRSASLDKRSKKLAARHPQISTERLFATLDLRDIDRGRPTLTIPFIGVLESIATSLAVTGATVSSTVSGGATAGVVVGAVAADAAVSMGLLGRSISEVAVHYGFDPREPEEELFLIGVLNYSMATSTTSKTAALAGLSRLAQQMMRRATWNQLGKEPLVRVVQRIFQLLGLRLTHARLANILPIAGGVITAGLSFTMLKAAIDDATRLYRARYLADKHGLSWDDWLTVPSQDDDVAVEVVDATEIEVDELIEGIIDDVNSVPRLGTAET